MKFSDLEMGNNNYQKLLISLSRIEYRFENTLLKFFSFLLTFKHEIKIIIEKSVFNFIINLNLNILYL